MNFINLSIGGSLVGEIKKDCPCKRIKCERHGQCEACREHHMLKKKTLPYCERLKEKVVRKERRYK